MSRPKAASACVAGGVAAGVVDGLEVVEVDEDQPERGLTRSGGVDLALERLLEGAVVAEPGDDVAERVDPGELVQVLKAPARGLELLRRPEHLAGHPEDEHGQQAPRTRRAAR